MAKRASVAKKTTAQKEREIQLEQLPEFYLIPAGVAQQLLNYLSQRPYAEVAQLIQVLGTMEPYKPEEAENGDK